jgi:hypothetical protein
MTANTAQDLVRQQVGLLQEAEIALYSIEAGLAALEKNRAYAPKPYYFAWYLLLSTGFERLMKIIVCLHEFEATGAFPTRRSLQRDIGHDLLRLRDAIVQRCYTPDYCQRVFGQDDLSFITSDPVLLPLLRALNDFAMGDRYLFMNQISDPAIGREWPKMRWEEIERIALSDAVYFQLLKDDYPELIRRSTKALKECVERFTRALTRLFIFGNLGSLARSQSATISEFTKLEDGNLGNKVYEA